MSMTRLVLRVVPLCAVVLFLALVFAVVRANAVPFTTIPPTSTPVVTNVGVKPHMLVSSYTYGQAEAKAAKEQRFDCRWSPVPGWYRCVTLFVVYPKCIYTYVNHPFHPEYICGGVYIRQSRLSGKYDICHTTYYLSPWGHVLNYRTYKCYGGSPLTAKDIKFQYRSETARTEKGVRAVVTISSITQRLFR